jgi:hypothetical protein
LPPGAILVLRLAPTPRFFLYKNPGNVVPPNQNCPLEGPEPKADILLYIYSLLKSGTKTKDKLILKHSDLVYLSKFLS